MIERHYVTLTDGQMHYLRAGEGPPVVLAHSSPMSAKIMLPWVEALAERFTVYAPDTAGYGQSDPLPGAPDDPRIPDYAQRMIEFADAVGLDRFTVGGTHTGSKIALAVAVAAPDRVAQLVMDGLGLYTGDELEEQMAQYTPPIIPNWHGSHLVEAWHRVRSMFTFWPWYRQEAERRLNETVPEPSELHTMVMDMLRAGPDWGRSYRAAFRYDAREALRQLRVPTSLITKHADPLHEHLDRLGLDLPTLEVRSVGNEEHLGQIFAAFRDDLGLEAAPAAPQTVHPGGTTRRYVRTEFGASHVRMDGDPDAPVLLFMHGSPGSAESFGPLIEELARDHLVVSPDTMGNGHSTPLAKDEPRTSDFGAATAAVLDGLGLSKVKAYGSHTGACIALECARQRPDLIATLVADGLPVFDDELRADLLENYLTDMTPQRHGEHLLHAWHVVRDAQLWWPWYRSTADGVRPTAPSDDERLHELVMAFLTSGPSYRHSYRASFLFDAKETLTQVEVPVHIVARAEDMLREASEALSGGPVSFLELDPEAGRDAAWAVRRV